MRSVFLCPKKVHGLLSRHLPWKAHMSKELSTMKNAFKILMAMLLLTVFTGMICVEKAGAAGKEGNRKDVSHTVKLKAKARVGSYLTDAKGMTLYYFKKDVPGKSACTGDCIAKWPVFYTKKVIVSKKLDKTDFAAITRGDGIKQTTYKGRPLYYFAKDAAAGDMNGEGVSSAWHVIYTQKIKR
jgi:predicted lipoprotein with Yx(FWY)xxD motif